MKLHHLHPAEGASKDRKRVKVVHTKEIPAGILGRWPESEILFRCE